MVRLSVVVPTFDEQGNVGELIARLDAVLGDCDAEIVFVDDSADRTPEVIRAAGDRARLPVHVRHRSRPAGGLSGAVVDGIAHSRGDWVVVMDADLQHPPELVPRLAAAMPGADVVVASRYLPGGSGAGLASPLRRLVSRGSTALARGLFPRRLHGCTDPMSGFFAVRRDAVDLRALRPRGFKILLEILGRHRLRIAEIPFAFAPRLSGASKAGPGQAVAYLGQLVRLRAAGVTVRDASTPPASVHPAGVPAAVPAGPAAVAEHR